MSIFYYRKKILPLLQMGIMIRIFVYQTNMYISIAIYRVVVLFHLDYIENLTINKKII